MIASIVGIFSLNAVQADYQQIKDNNFSLLLKMSELKAQTDGLIHISTEMLLSETANELQWDMLEASDKRLWIDKLFDQLIGHTDDHQQLLILKLRLYSHLDEIFSVVSNKFNFSEQFFKRYAEAEALKKESLRGGDMQFYIILDDALVHFNLPINKQFNENREADTDALMSHIDNILNTVDQQQAQKLQTLFLGSESLGVSYQRYLQQLTLFEQLRLKNEIFSEKLVSFIAGNLASIQDRFSVELVSLEHKIKERKQYLYIVTLSCLFISLLLLIMQFRFIRRIDVIRKVINAGNSDRNMHFTIKGKDEISQMARSVKSYVERLVIKEQELLAATEQLAHLVSYDSLTGTYNRQYFEAHLVQENARYLRYKEVYCLAMMDLDFFKQVNDNYGYEMGDKIIIEFAKRILLIIRETDVFARFGGKEFVLLMPNTSERDAFLLMDRIRLAMEEVPYNSDGQAITFTVSIGMVEVQRAEKSDPIKQITLAGKGLYEAKAAGRNKVCIYKG
ncbi:hypothetical protein GCM10007916_20680 [Psychromonas marina]|uniref:diguanylate cyclase n=1 Tax=Psychromonas marina TaxID=88364 RepID=A0ABQ6E0L9_9GAMM|nr:hypothetical protein GCM10007916_20680 [Psychromonas marina]